MNSFFHRKLYTTVLTRKSLLMIGGGWLYVGGGKCERSSKSIDQHYTHCPLNPDASSETDIFPMIRAFKYLAWESQHGVGLQLAITTDSSLWMALVQCVCVSPFVEKNSQDIFTVNFSLPGLSP